MRTQLKPHSIDEVAIISGIAANCSVHPPREKVLAEVSFINTMTLALAGFSRMATQIKRFFFFNIFSSCFPSTLPKFHDFSVFVPSLEVLEYHS